MIGLFLATLELIRQKKIAVEQSEVLGEIRIKLREDAADQTLFQQEEPHVSHEAPAPSAPPAMASEPAAEPATDDAFPSTADDPS
jgi:hypothetical protein